MGRLSREGKTIFRVPNLLREPNLKFYAPTFVSIGFYHLGNSRLRNMVDHKGEAYARMCFRINPDFPRELSNISEFTSRILPDIEAQRPWIQLYEGEGKDVASEFCHTGNIATEFCKPFRSPDPPLWGFEAALFWLIIDACYIFEFLVNYLRRIKGKENYLDEWVVRFSNDFIFDSWIQNPTWQSIVCDLLLLENQIPLSCLTFLAEMGGDRQLPRLGSGVGAKETIIQMMWDFASLNNYGIFTWLSPCSSTLEEPSHLLDLFYKRIVGSDLKSYEDGGYPWEESESFLSLPPWFKDLVVYWKNAFARFFRQWSSPVRGFFPLSTPMDGEVSESPPAQQIPSAAELSRMGVKFHAVRRPSRMNATPIRYIRFDERKSALYLPEVRVDWSAQTLLMNFIALEVTSAKYHPRPVTNFALFMDELINTEDDVGVLRRAGILKNLVSTDAELAHNFNGLRTGLPFNEGFKAVDEARLGIRKFLKRRYKILWNEFLATYFSKPWLFLGTVGAVLLLLMTVLQVMCLFSNCNPSERKLYG